MAGQSLIDIDLIRLKPLSMEYTLRIIGICLKDLNQPEADGISQKGLFWGMHKLKWKDQASCLDYDTNLFFDKYEEDINLRPAIDLLCINCPVLKTCFAVGVSSKEYGVWGGIYLDAGNPSKEFNDHKTEQDWSNIWQKLTLEKQSNE